MTLAVITERDIPPIRELGLPAKFASWRPGQADALARILASDKRFAGVCMPTGSGKSLVYVAAANLVGRAVVLTSTKGLQDQLIRDFHEAGLVDIRGMNNYECRAVGAEGEFPFFRDEREPVACDEAPCTGGYRCELKEAGCSYFDAKRAAMNSTLVVTNYSYWLRVNQTEKGLGQFDLLIMDEAHDAPDELADFLSVEMGASELEMLLDEDFPRDTDDFEWWRQWGAGLGARLDMMAEQYEEDRHEMNRASLRHLKSVRNLRDRMQAVVGAKGEWVQESYRDHRGSRKLRFSPVNPKEYTGELFQDAKKVLFVSATVRPYTMGLMGLGEDQYDFIESRTAFDARRRPVIHVPTVRMRHDMTPDQMRMWVNRIDQIMDRRQDRKGIIHTVSYRRAEYLLKYSRWAHAMMMPKTATTRQVVEAFKRRPAPCALVSPAVSTGFDFPYEECRYQVIGKIPFPDTRSKVLKAREDLDKDYGPYVAMQQLVQACGRGMRAADDWCENLVIDDQWVWFIQKYRSFAPEWFLRAVRTSMTVPEALKIQRLTDCAPMY